MVNAMVETVTQTSLALVEEDEATTSTAPFRGLILQQHLRKNCQWIC